VTGIIVDAGVEAGGKRLQLLKEVAPAASRIGFLARKAVWEGIETPLVVRAMRSAAETYRGSVAGRVVMSGAVAHVEDISTDPEYVLPIATMAGYRSVLGVPMLRGGVCIGAIIVARDQVVPFSDKQIDLLKTFADQAVIAIENARLFEEVWTRTRELTESLEYQTATSDVLGVINRSKFDLNPVLDTIARVASTLCGDDVTIQLREGEDLRAAAHHGSIPIDLDRRQPIGRGWVAGRAVVDRQPIHVRDLAAAGDEFPLGRDRAHQLGHRTTLAIPLLREDQAIGALLVRRLVEQPYSGEQIALLQTFADQAVIAIENTRMFEEVQERTGELQARNRELRAALEQQTATQTGMGSAYPTCVFFSERDGRRSRSGGQRGTTRLFAKPQPTPSRKPRAPRCRAPPARRPGTATRRWTSMG
jgi:GAF domain-containing protein